MQSGPDTKTPARPNRRHLPCVTSSTFPLSPSISARATPPGESRHMFPVTIHRVPFRSTEYGRCAARLFPG